MPNPIQIAAKLYDNRDTLKEFYGPSFPTIIKPFQDHLQNFATWHQVGVLDAALALAKDLEKGGHGRSVPVLLAAAVELVEPSGK